VIYSLLRPLIFTLDPERAHALVMTMAAALDAAARRLQPAPLTDVGLEQELWGLRFPNPVGLAGGFDKSAHAPHAWASLGFGFAELGTITALAQPGNPPPRIFRLPEDEALINRLGFNNDGAAAVAERLGRDWTPPTIPLGFNLGKSRATPLEEATADYARSLRALFPFADYIAVNVSSPNTPGLRDLQAEDHLARLLDELVRVNRECARDHGRPPRPLLVKIAPDLGDEGIAAAVRVAIDGGAAGLIATNTTIGRQGLRAPVDEAGGLSGRPLRARSTQVVRIAHQAAAGRLPIIGVGGIFSADDAWEKLRAGASLVQIYTGLIYEGPLLARHIVHGLAERMRREGKSVTDLLTPDSAA
jgi:dihydroorotate dehydrogenase